MCDLDDLDPDPEPDPITDNALWGGQSWREPLLLALGVAICIIAILLILTTAAPAQSVVFHVRPVPDSLINVDTLSASAAMFYLARPDSNEILRDIATGDVTGDHRVATSDIIYMVNYILRSGPKPKSPLISQFRKITRPDGTSEIWYILVDSVGATP